MPSPTLTAEPGPSSTVPHADLAPDTWADEVLLGFDLETTGVDVESDVMVSFALTQMDSGIVFWSAAKLVDPGRDIPAGAIAIHGITTERAASEGMPADEALSVIVHELTQASADNVPVVGMNLRYDLAIVDRALRRSSGQGLAETGFTGPVVDIQVLDRHMDPHRKGRRTLGALATHYGVEAGAAHDAAGDVLTTLRVLREMASRFPALVAMDLADLHQAQIAWHRSWAESFSQWRVQQGKPALTASDAIWPFPPPGEDAVVVHQVDTAIPEPATAITPAPPHHDAPAEVPLLSCQRCSRPTMRRDDADLPWCLVCQADASPLILSESTTERPRQRVSSAAPTKRKTASRRRYEEDFTPPSLF